jgi:PfpI family intracellular protease
VADKLQGKRVAFLATDMVEQVELTEPWKAVKDEGAEVELISLEEGEIQGFDHYDKADTFKVDRTVEEARADDYDALVIPGGVGNPDTMRTDENAVELVRQFFEQGKPVGVICHGPWMLVEAGVVRGPHGHVVAKPADRHPERGRELGRRGGRRRQRPRHQPQARRPACFHEEDRRGVLRGPSRAAGGGDRPRRRGAQVVAHAARS